MAVDKSLLNLEERKENGDLFLPSMRIAGVPGSRGDTAADLNNLAEGLLTGKSAKELDDLNSKLTGYVTLVPEPGLCVKMREKSGKKIFLNLCISDRLPPLPKDINEDELVRALQSLDISFRVPMSIGEPHNETDHAGEACVAYEVVIHPSLFKKLESSELFYQFFLSLALEGLENKYELCIDRKTTLILKGKKFYGILKEQRIRTKPKLITEIDSEEKPESLSPLLLHVTPQFKLWLDPKEQKSRLLRAEIELPSATNKDEIDLFIAENRLVLTSSLIRPKNYRLDVLFPVEVSSDAAMAVFDSTSKVLTVTAPMKEIMKSS